MKCPRCDADNATGRIFCGQCGKVLSPDVLRSVRLPGFVGVEHSTSPKIEEFWRTGDPGVFHPEGKSA